MPAQTLRPYQQTGLQRIMTAWKAGARSVLCVSPTGSGKTSLFCYLADQVQRGGKRVLINVHRRELAAQACNRLREFGVDFGLVMAGEQPKPYSRVQVASVQTLVRRMAPPADLVINDEAHLSTAKTWQTIIAHYPNARILGVTATPFRLSGKPLIGSYDDSVIVSTPRELREQGFLCGYDGFSYLTPDLDKVRTTAGEYNEHDAAEAMSGSLIVDNCVEEWGKHARDLSTIVFAVTVEHSKALCAKFVAAGVRAEHLDGSTPREQRKAILARVDAGTTRVLCNVGVAVEGLDIPRLKCLIDAAPTKSLAKAMQKWGRVRRPWQGVMARIHDHAFNIKLHGLPDADRDYSLNAKPENPPSLRTCGKCLALFLGNQCTACAEVAEVAEVTERALNTVEDAEQFAFSSTSDAVPEQLDAKPVEVKWTTPGRVVEGVLDRRWEETTQYGPQVRYLVRGDKRSWSLPGTTRLNALMFTAPIGAQLRITYVKENALPGGKSRKEFRVEIDDGL